MMSFQLRSALDVLCVFGFSLSLLSLLYSSFSNITYTHVLERSSCLVNVTPNPPPSAHAMVERDQSSRRPLAALHRRFWMTTSPMHTGGLNSCLHVDKHPETALVCLHVHFLLTHTCTHARVFTPTATEAFWDRGLGKLQSMGFLAPSAECGPLSD